MQARSTDPLVECIMSSPTRWPGRSKIEACPSENQLQMLQRIPGTWVFENARNALETGYYVPQSVKDMGMYPANLEDYEEEAHNKTPSGLVLRSYEARAVTFLRQLHREREGAMLVADPGLGKTITALHSLWLDGYLQKPGLVIGPNIAKGVWCDDDADALVHYSLPIMSLEGVKNLDVEILKKYPVIFCHYDILKAWQTWIFATLKPTWMIIDESHYLINQKAQRSMACRQLALCSSIDRRIALTGTAIPNERMDLWNQLATVQPRQWGSNKHDFGVRYCGGIRLTPEEGGHWMYDGETNDRELKARLAGTYLRYTTEDVANELPPVARHVIEADVDDDLLDEYSHAQRDITGYLGMKGAISEETTTISIGTTTIKLKKQDKKPGAVQLVCLTTLIGILSKMKRAAALRAVSTIFEKHNRLVIFTWRKETSRWIHSALVDLMAKGWAYGDKKPTVFGPVDGDMKMAERKRLAKEFSKCEHSIYVATMGSAGTSINTLSSASAALMVDLHWNTTDLRQSEKRVHRDGCTADHVDIYYLVVRRTVDDLFIDKLRMKAEKAASISDRDTAGLSLVHDLTPEKARSGFDMDLLCERLMAMD